MARINSKYQIGEFDAVIALQEMTESRDTNSGTISKSWATDSSPWAKIEYKPTVRENISADSERIMQRVDFVIRGVDDPGVTEKWRISYDSKVYDIESVVVEGRNQFIRLVTEFKDDG